MNKGLPVSVSIYREQKLLIDMIPVYYVNNAFIDCISLVDQPAIESDFILFNKQIRFQSDNKQRSITGPILIPDMKIYRRDESGEYYLAFSKESIKQFASDLITSGNTKNVSVMHNGQLLTGIKPTEVYIKDSTRNILNGFEDLPDGTLFITYLIEDADLYNRIVNENYSGFSIEAEIKIKKEDLFNKIKTTR